MRFFERLAPSARTQHAVQPALPPRFAGAGADIEEIQAEALAIPLRAAAPWEAPSAAQHETIQARPTTMRIDAPAHATARPATHSAPPLTASMSARSPEPMPNAAHAREAKAASPLLHEASPLHFRRDVSSPAPAPSHPLSPIALAQRLHPTKSDESTIVHVTIDRIDVRVPAPAQAPRDAAKPRAVPTMSLADYLRRGKA